MKIKAIIIVWMCLCLFQGLGIPAAWAQQRPVFSQYMFNGLILNPAYAGHQKQLSVSLLYRDQWVNFDGAPKTETLIAHTAFKDWPVGAGLLISRDQIGVHDDYSIYGSYSYKIGLPVGTLSAGLQAGFNYTRSDFSKLRNGQINDPNFAGMVVRFSPNFGTGAFFSNKTTYAGISVPYLINNKVVKKEDFLSEAREARYYFVTGGHVFTLSDALKLKPSTLIRVQEGQPMGLDLNANLFIQDIVNVGTSYRSGDAIIFLFEIILNQNITFGYAYDRTLSRIVNYTDGTHELMLTFRRGLGHGPCHAYF